MFSGWKPVAKVSSKLFNFLTTMMRKRTGGGRGRKRGTRKQSAFKDGHISQFCRCLNAQYHGESHLFSGTTEKKKNVLVDFSVLRCIFHNVSNCTNQLTTKWHRNPTAAATEAFSSSSIWNHTCPHVFLIHPSSFSHRTGTVPPSNQHGTKR